MRERKREKDRSVNGGKGAACANKKKRCKRKSGGNENVLTARRKERKLHDKKVAMKRKEDCTIYVHTRESKSKHAVPMYKRVWVLEETQCQYVECVKCVRKDYVPCGNVPLSR